MNNFFLVMFLGIAVVLVQAKEQCFDPELVDSEWNVKKADCKPTITGGDDERVNKLYKCIITKLGLYTEGGELDYDKFRSSAEQYLISNVKTEILNWTEHCWDSSSGESKALQFVDCYEGKIQEMCSDALQWD